MRVQLLAEPRRLRSTLYASDEITSTARQRSFFYFYRTLSHDSHFGRAISHTR